MKISCFKMLLMCIILTLFLPGCAMEAYREGLKQDNPLNSNAYQLITDGEYDKAISLLEGILNENSLDDTALNNMAWALYMKGHYQEAQEYIDKALSIEPNNEVEYVNQGNILLENNPDINLAIQAYEKALNIDRTCVTALYGKGIAYSAQGDYLRAAEAFEAYIQLKPEDPDGHENLGYIYIHQGQYNKAIEQSDFLIKNHKSSRGYLMKSACAYMQNNEAETEKMFLKYLNTLDSDLSLFSKLSGLMTDHGDYQNIIKYNQIIISKHPQLAEPYFNIANACLWLRRYDEAEVACLKALQNDSHTPEYYNLLGDVYAEKTLYKKAIEQYKMAFGLDTQYLVARSNLMWAMHQACDYPNLITFCDTLIKEEKADFQTYWYLAAAYEGLFEYDKAIDFYTKALSYDEGDDSDTSFHIAQLYYYKRDFFKAREYNSKALSYNTRNSDALWLSEELALLETSIGNQLAEFIRKYYLYQEYVSEFQSKLSALRACTDMASAEKILSEILIKEDYFTFIIKDEDYRAYQKENETQSVSYSTARNASRINMHFFKIEFFSQKTGQEFISLAEKIPHKENSVLIIDLRGNPGGDMKASSEILDYLLPSCATVNFLDKNGYSKSYYSSEDKEPFKQILVLQDSDTASASEHLTLGLLQYADNLTIIGEKSFGKGVSQYIFDSPENGFALFLVNSYWNVREANIYYYGITPDIKATTEKDFDLAIHKAIQ